MSRVWANRRVIPFAGAGGALALHAGAAFHPLQAHPAGSLVGCGLLLVLATGCEKPRRLWRLCLRLLVLLVLAPAFMRAALLVHPLAECGAASLVAVLTAAPVAAYARRLRSLSHISPARRAVAALAPAPPTGMAMARAELALLWFGLFRWRVSIRDQPVEATAFHCTATGNDVAMAWLTAAGSVIEIPLFHILIGHFSLAGAWVATALDGLLIVYLAGFAKSLQLRPTLLFPDRLLIRLGAVASRSVALRDIRSVRLLPPDTRRNPASVRLYGFDVPNMAVVTAGQELRFRLDHPERLVAALGTT